MSERGEEHYEEVERLWRAVKRDYFHEVEVMAGIAEMDDPRWRRLLKNWNSLCALDTTVAAHLYHGLQQIEMVFARRGEPDSPADYRVRQLAEVVGLAEIGRAANPDAGDLTTGEIVRLGHEEIRWQINRELGD